MVVAIDGPAGAGKSTVARRVAEAVGFLYINSGSFYRAITLAVLEAGWRPDETARVVEKARECRLSVRHGNLTLNGRDVESLIHSDRVDAWVAGHSSIPEVREIVNRALRTVSLGRDVVVEGRDIGTVVFPDAAVKIYLDADVKTRARRRFEQGITALSLAEVEKSIEERDRVDRSKPSGRLEPAADAIRVDASHLTIEAVCETVIQAILVSKNNPGDICGP